MRDTLKKGSLGADVRKLQTMLNTIGASLATDGVFGDKTAAAVRSFQRDHGLLQDAIVGPKTWAALEGAVRGVRIPAKTPAPEPPRPTYTDEDLAAAGRSAIETALHWWADDIYDPRIADCTATAVYSKAAIDTFIRLGLGWTWEDQYKGDGDFEWCGAFAASCWERIKPELRKLYFASTYRLDRYASYRPAFGETPDHQPDELGRWREVVDGDEGLELLIAPRAGDILLIGRKSYGSHICLVESFNPETRVFHTVEGNARGLGPNGELQQGVIRTARNVEDVRRIIRPGVGDLA